MAEYATISFKAVHLSFGSVHAIKDLTFAAHPGTITVLLGPNGAGKTTAIRLITGALTPTSGTVTVLDRSPESSGGEYIRQNCGVVSAKPSLYDRLNGFDNLLYAAELYGLKNSTQTKYKIMEAATRFGIEHALLQRVGNYSTGMKTRLALARAILHDPQILLLDEPTSGLDPESAYAVLDLIRTMTVAGQTVLMCTHLLSEAEGLADEIIVIEQGESLQAGKPSELAKRYWPHPEVLISANDGRALDILATAPHVKDYVRQGPNANIVVDDLAAIPDLVSHAATAGAMITRVQPHEPSLEELYFAIRKEADSGVAPPGATPSPAANKTSDQPVDQQPHAESIV